MTTHIVADDTQWAYEMSNENLIDAFSRACAQAGMSNSGLIIDMMASVHVAEVRYLKGVLLARLEGVKPPFKRGDVVQTKSGKGVSSADYWAENYRWGNLLPPDPHQKISRIHYEGNGRWLLEFEDILEGERGYPRFDASEFILETPVVVVGKKR